MGELDDKIRDALNDDADDGQIQTIRDLLGEVMRSHSRVLNVTTWLKMAMFAGLAVFAAIMFFRSEATNELIGFATLFVLSTAGIWMLWMFYWMMLNRNALMREIKRVELQVARLSDRLDN